MAFLLFAYMKQSLKLRIDRGQYRLANLTNKINDLQDQISIMTQAKDASENMSKQVIGNITAAGSSLFQGVLNTAQNNYYGENAKYMDLQNRKNNGEAITQEQLDLQKGAVEAANTTLMNTNWQVQQETNAFQSRVVAMNAGVNSIFAAQTKAQLDYLQHEETTMDQEKAQLESQLKAWQSQYDSYEKAEDSAAKDLAPKFGLS